MRAVVQRVLCASVTVHDQTGGSVAGQTADSAAGPFAGRTVAQIGVGLLVYAAAAPDDTDDDIQYIADKVANLRIFPDAGDRMNLSVRDMHGAGGAGAKTHGSILLVSAFTVLADARKGRRPSFDSSASGPVAEPLIEKLAAELRTLGLPVETGRFAAYMHVESVNDGPICILLDSRRVV